MTTYSVYTKTSPCTKVASFFNRLADSVFLVIDLTAVVCAVIIFVAGTILISISETLVSGVDRRRKAVETREWKNHRRH
jgi:hypothetical protein